MRTPVVDVHAHVLLPEVERLIAGRPEVLVQQENQAKEMGADSVAVSIAMLRQRSGRMVDVGQRIAAMDASGVDIQLVSVSPSQYHYWADVVLAEQVCRAINEGVAEHCARRPHRLVGLGVVPLQHPGLAVAALEDAIARGLKGVELSSFAPDPGGRTVELSDPRLEPLWTRAEQLGALIFVHPFGCSLGARLDRWYLSNVVGQPVEHAVALSHLIFAGVLDRHPGLRVLAAHGGGYLPWQLARADHGWRIREDVRGCARPPSEYLRELYLDSLVYSASALRALVAAVGADRVLLGSDFPFDMGIDDPLVQLRAAGLSAHDTAAIASTNAMDLGLVPALTVEP